MQSMIQTPDSLLDAVVGVLTDKDGEVVVSTWFRNARAVTVKNDKLYISVPTEMERGVLKEKFTGIVSEILKDIDVSGRSLRPEFITEEEALGISQNASGGYSSKYTFENYIVGPSNRYAHAAATAVAQGEGSEYNPLFIYGPPGLGKTHLLFAIAGAVKKRLPSANVVYAKSEELLNELVSAIKTGRSDFREKYRTADFLLVDDVQFFVGKGSLQEEFFNIFNTLHEKGNFIVLTADKPPRDLALVERLVSRFEMGLAVGIDTPELETRMAMVDDKSRAIGLVLSPEIIDYIASNITNNVRELEGAVHKIKARSSLIDCTIDLPMVQEALRDLIKERPGLHPTPQLILSETAIYYSIPEEKILSKDNSQHVSNARQVACYLMKEMTEMSFPAIASFMNRNHSSIIYSTNTVRKKIEDDSYFESEIKEIRQTIENK
ncbi:MAG: chromosomal replication initiator protein DnaA [Clostridia bacterium]|nr:chromosomal replication initiator protein DnaA [Clostridia bacterium]